MNDSTDSGDARAFRAYAEQVRAFAIEHGAKPAELRYIVETWRLILKGHMEIKSKNGEGSLLDINDFALKLQHAEETQGQEANKGEG